MTKYTGRIITSSSSILPGDHESWPIARVKTKEAKSGLAMMRCAATRPEFIDGWIKCVDSLQEAWVSFEHEGNSLGSSFKGWFGQSKKSRKKDPLLRYMYEARNQSQHGHVVIEWAESHLNIAPNFTGTIKSLRVSVDSSYVFDAEPAYSGNPPSLELVHGLPQLPTITNKKTGNSYAPPKMHLGQPINTGCPATVASMAITYQEDVFEAAFSRFSDRPYGDL